MEHQQTVATFINQSKEFYDHCHEFYKPLHPDRNEIRLMQILPGPFSEETINLTVSHMDLADEPYYETISYMWEDLSPTKQIFIHGVAYNVTVNQYAALRRLRSDQPRTMWMDVICIDQANLAERTLQVSIVGEIYAKAARTEVWLGELDETWYTPLDDEAWNSYLTWFWDFLDREKFIQRSASPQREELLEAFPRDIANGGVFVLEQLAADVHFDQFPYCSITGDKVKLNRSWYDAGRLLDGILKRPWWSRVWVLQEVMLCKGDPMVSFGQHRVPLGIFLKAWDSMHHHVVVSRCCVSVLPDVFLDGNIMEGLVPLMWLSTIKTEEQTPGQMYMARAAALSNKRHATDIRDFIYGVRGLLRDEERVPVDYTLSTEQRVVLASWHFLRERNEFHWLEKGGWRSPSWCIDWTNTDRLGFRLNSTFAMNEAETPDWNRTQLSGSRLKLPANLIGEVKLVFEKQPNPAVPLATNDIETINDWLDCLKEAGFTRSDSLRQPESWDESDGELFVEFLAACFRDTKFDPKTLEARRLNEDDIIELSFWWSGMVQIMRSGLDRGDHERFVGLSMTFRNYTEGYALALTMNDKICLVPNGTKVGDVLYHIRACSPVMVLHPVAEAEFHLVGPAFLNEKMGSKGWCLEDETVITAQLRFCSSFVFSQPMEQTFATK